MTESDRTYKQPVLVIAYNRVEPLKKLVQILREVKPSRVYLTVDGPKEADESDKKKVMDVRSYLSEQIDWKADIFTLFREQNMGVKHAVYDAIRWFFTNEESGVILEDDCHPVPAFFTYCDLMLVRYKDHPKIGMISGRNELGSYGDMDSGHYFLSTRGFIWGWATWRDRIDLFDIEISHKISTDEIMKIFRQTSSLTEFFFRMKHIRQLNTGRLETWDYQWNLTLLLNQKYSIIPKQNLVRNVGFGEDATHATDYKSDLVDLHSGPSAWMHPNSLETNDRYTLETIRRETGGLCKLLVSSILTEIKRGFK